MIMTFPITQAMRTERRKRAEERQAEYDKLTLQQKLEKLPAPPHAAKQRAKLEGVVAAQAAKAEAAKLATVEKAKAKEAKKGDNK
jgi:hypothetical protein